jgi:MFS family permease
MVASAVVTAALALVIWWRVRDDPSEAGYLGHAAHPAAGGGHGSILRGLAQVMSYRNAWLLFLVPGGIAGGVLTFAGLWGVPYFTQVYGYTTKEAALLTSTMLIAWAVGGPLLGTASERLGRRKPLYVAGAVVATAGWAAIAFLPPLPFGLLLALLVVLGFASGCMIIGFAFVKESVPAALTGTASGIVNTGVMMGAMILQPAVGWLLDRHWQGAMAGGARLYELAAYQSGFLLLFAWAAVSLVLISLTRETHCRAIV